MSAASTHSALSPPSRVLLGPGPSLVHPRVLQAMTAPIISHLDPIFLSIMDEIQERLRWLFHTSNPFTIAISGTGSAAMEAAVVNLIEPGDTVIVGVNGVFGGRLAQMIERCGGTALRLEFPWGHIIPPEAIEHALNRHHPIKAVALVHAETSTGAWQPLEDIGPLCHAHDALLLVDAVTSLGGMPVKVDEWGIDACYSATQKCLSCPPGLAPLTFSERAMAAIANRKTPCQSWYLDSSLLAAYWSERTRTYHHTAPISMAYALREALQIIYEEGLSPRYARHRRNQQALVAGLNVLGFRLLPSPEQALPSLTCVSLPTGWDDKSLRRLLLEEFNIDIGGGLGPLAGQVWRIGLMGESSRLEHVLHLLGALEVLAHRLGLSQHRQGDALQAALSTYTHPPSYPGNSTHTSCHS
ncbi:MAG: alanine--glyoxylate aminotransferase family protein [Nitrospirae bacterium]|nr:MAG: alanine--glyoxylate aminotransferase family protein [Nitrospirota bacterium]